jgi:hypothetical protein
MCFAVDGLDDLIADVWQITWCQCPSITFGPACSCLLPTEPRNMHDVCPFGWTSSLIWPPLLPASPFTNMS